MSLAATASPAEKQPASASAEKQIAILVVEGKSMTPLGPKILFANESVCRLTGYQLGDLIGSPLGLVYDHKDLRHLIRKLPVIANAKDYCWMDRSLNHNGGKRSQVRWTIRPTKQKGDPSPYFTLTISEIPKSISKSAPKKAASPIPEKAKPLPQKPVAPISETRDESLAITAGGVAHDFKNALQTIKSNLELAGLVSATAGPLQNKLDEHLGDAQTALKDAEALARQMLALTKGGDPQHHVFDLTGCLQRVSKLTTAGSCIRNRLRIPPSLRPVMGDSDQVYQVFHNLVINAAQSMTNGGTIDISAANVDFSSGENDFSVPPGRYTLVSIRDRGCGISPEKLPHIFDPDFTTKDDGCGFGLASCRAIINKHGGAIRVASRVGIGTEFLVFLPSSDHESYQPKTEPEEDPSPGPSRGSRPVPSAARILVVDDEHGVCKSTCSMLQHFGYETVAAESSAEAIRTFRLHNDSPEPIDLVVLDMTLPGGLDGKDVLKELKRFDDQVKIIATSGYFEDNPSEEFFELGFTAVLAKPYSMESLAVTVEEVLAC